MAKEWRFHWLNETEMHGCVFSQEQLVNSCHCVHTLGLSQHLFAEQRFDLVMTSGNVSFQQRRSSELGELAGEGGGGGQSGEGEKRREEGTGWGTAKGALLQSSSCFTMQSSCVDHRRCMGWMTNKCRKSSQVGAVHNEVSVNPWPQTIMGPVSTAVDPSL